MQYKVLANVLITKGNPHEQGAILTEADFESAEDIQRRIDQGGLEAVKPEEKAEKTAKK